MAGDPLDIKTEAARQSLTQGIENIYDKVPAGGAFDAKTIETQGGMASLVKDGKTQDYLETVYTTPGFKTKMSSLLTQFNNKALNWANTFYKHSSRKYR